MNKRLRVAVLASGGGTNVQALLDACGPEAPADVVLVATDRPGAGAVRRAEAAGVATGEIGDPRDARALGTLLEAHRADLVVLAGYLRLVPTSVVEAFAGRMVNIHPALLPAFGGKGMYGLNVHRAVLAAGATVTGATVHLVTAEYDRGPIIAQWPVPVHANDTPESLQRRVLAVEHRLLPAVVLAAGRNGRVTRLVLGDAAFAAADAPGLHALVRHG